MSEKKVFQRQATGLVRGLSGTDAIILATGVIFFPAWVTILTGEWFFFPGVNIPASFILIGILSAIYGMYYVIMSTVMPRSGGGYVWLSRTVHPVLGMGASFVLAAVFILAVGTNSVVTPSVISGSLITVGTVSNIASLQSAGSFLSTQSGILIAGTIGIILVGIVQILGIRAIKLVNRVTFIIGTLGTVVMAVVLASTTVPQFQSTLDSFAGSGTYANITSTAAANGWSIPSNWVTPTFLSLPFAFYGILGFAFGTYYSGEIRRVERSISLAVIFSIVYSVFFYSLFAVLMQYKLGNNFIQSAGFLFNAAPANYPLSFPPFVNNFVTLINSNLELNAVVIISFICLGYLVVTALWTQASRIILGWSFDRVIPSRLGAVSERFHSPVTATIIVGVIGWIALVVYTFLPVLSIDLDATYLFIAGLLFDGIAGIVLPFRKNLFEPSPPLAKKKILGVPLVSLLGGYSLMFMVALVIASLFNPSAYGSFGLPTLLAIVSTFVAGVICYFAMKTYLLRRSGLNISYAFKEIPPE